MKKGLYLLLAVLCFAACEKKNAPAESEFVDLGLTSGTKWKSLNESNPKDPNGAVREKRSYQRAVAGVIGRVYLDLDRQRLPGYGTEQKDH